MRCPKCGAEVAEQARFCPKCGNTMKIICPKCGRELPSGTKFCSSCGTVLTSGQKKNTAGGGKDSRRPSGKTSQKKKNAVLLIVTVLIAMLLLGAAAGGVYYMFFRSDSQTEEREDREEDREEKNEDSLGGEKAENEEDISSEEETSAQKALENPTLPSEPLPSSQTESAAISYTAHAYEMPTAPGTPQQGQQSYVTPYGDYIIADSHLRYLTKEELSSYTKDQLRLARNEIYARHGRLFNDEALQSYFNSKSWYNGTVSSGSFNANILNEYEKKNLLTIKAVEDSRP